MSRNSVTFHSCERELSVLPTLNACDPIPVAGVTLESPSPEMRGQIRITDKKIRNLGEIYLIATNVAMFGMFLAYVDSNLAFLRLVSTVLFVVATIFICIEQKKFDSIFDRLCVELQNNIARKICHQINRITKRDLHIFAGIIMRCTRICLICLRITKCQFRNHYRFDLLVKNLVTPNAPSY